MELKKSMTDVHVIGAGPTGSVAAIVCARNGKSVLVSEEHKSAGGKVCTGLFSASGLKTIERYFSWKESVQNEIYGAEIYFNEEKIIIEKRSPVAFVCDRDSFDRQAASAAEDEGALVEYGKRVVGNYPAYNIIAADGALSSTASFFNFPKITKFVGAIKGEVRASWDERLVKVFFSSAFPGFLGWAVPRGDRTFEIGCGVVLPNRPAEAFARLEKMLGVRSTSKKAAVIPLRPRKKTAAIIGKYDVRLVGDAAGQVKAISGGGVIFGSWCAEIAASASTPLNYEIGWRFKYGQELLIHRLIRKFLDSIDDKRLSNFGRKLRESNASSFIEENGDMEYASSLLFNIFKKPSLLLTLL